MHAVFTESTPDNHDTEKCKPVIIENATTTTKSEPDIDHQTQPTNGCPAGMTNILNTIIILVSMLKCWKGVCMGMTLHKLYVAHAQLLCWV